MNKKKILLEISKYCENCPINNKCVEEECVLFRIEKLILEEINKNKKYNSERRCKIGL